MKYLIIIFIIFSPYILFAQVLESNNQRILKRNNNENIKKIIPENNTVYKEVGIVDLYVEKYKYINKNIKMKVSISNDLTKKIFSIFENASMTGVSFFASNKNVPIDQVKFALKNCSVLCNRTFILGKFVNNNGFFKIEIHSLIFPEWGLN